MRRDDRQHRSLRQHDSTRTEVAGVMRLNSRYVLDTTLRIVVTVALVLQSWLAQSCALRAGAVGSPVPTPADALAPAAAPAPPAPHGLPVAMGFTDPSACAAFAQDGYPCRWIEQEGTPVGVEVQFAGLARDGLPLVVPGWSAREDWRGFDWLELDIENRGTERLTLGLVLRNDLVSWQDDQVAGFILELAVVRRVTWRVPLRQLQYTASGWVWELGGEAGSFRAWGRLDLAHVREVRLTQWNGGGEGRVGLYRADLVGPFAWRGWVDRYGQRQDRSWPRKVHSDAELIEFDQHEQQLLDTVTQFAD